MEQRDVPAAEATWAEASNTMRTAYHLPLEPRTPETATRMRKRLLHLMTTDPGGSWVAEDDDGHVVGLAQGLIRDDLWVLSLFGVMPRCQERGRGRSPGLVPRSRGRRGGGGRLHRGELADVGTAVGHRRRAAGGTGSASGRPGDDAWLRRRAAPLVSAEWRLRLSGRG